MLFAQQRDKYRDIAQIYGVRHKFIDIIAHLCRHCLPPEPIALVQVLDHMIKSLREQQLRNILPLFLSSRSEYVLEFFDFDFLVSRLKITFGDY